MKRILFVFLGMFLAFTNQTAQAAKLGDKETILEQLSVLSTQVEINPFFKVHYPPLLLQYADQEMNPKEIAGMITEINSKFFYNYLKYCPDKISRTYVVWIEFLTPPLLDAIFPDSPKEAAEALRILGRHLE